MREIMFKAKGLKSNDWIYGYVVLFENQKKGYIIRPTESDEINSEILSSYRIDINTLCEYTGYRDSKERRIFTNDIIEYQENMCDDKLQTGIVKRGEELFYVISKLTKQSLSSIINRSSFAPVKIIGNRFDNDMPDNVYTSVGGFAEEGSESDHYMWGSEKAVDMVCDTEF